MASENSLLWNVLSEKLFANIDEKFIENFRAPGGPNNRLAAWDPFDRTMRYFKFMLFSCCSRKPDRFFDLYRSLGNTNVGAPTTIRMRGLDINIDHLFAVEEFMFIDKALDFRTIKAIVEIGAGFGRTAHALMALAPQIETYIIVDIPSVLRLSQQLLKRLVPDRYSRIRFIDATSADAWKGLRSDLAINIDSFQEMLPGTIDAYRDGIVRNARYAYIKNPICKYSPQCIGIEADDPSKLNDVFSLGYCREMIDIFDDDALKPARRKYLDAYRPAPSWQAIADEPLDMFPYLQHALYRAN